MHYSSPFPGHHSYPKCLPLLWYPLFIFTTTNETFSKIHSSLSDKRLLCPSRSPGVPPELSKGRYGHVSTHLDNPTCPSCAQGNGNEGVRNKLLSEVTLDQPARMTLYTTLCGN
ncbi:hypothetical protein YC2023_033663 [Brassica napus]